MKGSFSEKKRTAKGSPKGGDISELSPAAREVFYMIVTEELTLKQVASRRGTSLRAVQKIRRTLFEKGLIDRNNRRVRFSRVTSRTSEPLEPFERYRVHGQKWVVNIIHKSDTYTRAYQQGNVVSYGGQTIHLHPGLLVIDFNEHFYGSNPDIALSRSFDFLNNFLRLLEAEYHLTLLKPRKHNIRLVQLHVAEIDNELAKEVNLSADRIRVYGTDDNKAWFEIDNSFNLNEAETIHHVKAVRDMADVVAPFFNDLRDKPHLLPSVLSAHQLATQDALRELGEHILTTRQEVADLRAVMLGQQNVGVPKSESLGVPYYVG